MQYEPNSPSQLPIPPELIAYLEEELTRVSHSIMVLEGRSVALAVDKERDALPDKVEAGTLMRARNGLGTMAGLLGDDALILARTPWLLPFEQLHGRAFGMMVGSFAAQTDIPVGSFVKWNTFQNTAFSDERGVDTNPAVGEWVIAEPGIYLIALHGGLSHDAPVAANSFYVRVYNATAAKTEMAASLVPTPAAMPQSAFCFVTLVRQTTKTNTYRVDLGFAGVAYTSVQFADSSISIVGLVQ